MANLPTVIQRTAAEWAASNQYIPRQTLAIESDTGKSKVGVGLQWSSTPYAPDVVSGSVSNIVSITQAAYDALETKDSSTLYVIT